VLRHDGIDHPHLDLMVETSPDSLLATWRLETWPVIGEIPAVRLADHRRRYLDYEGPLSDNRGFVRQIESGDCDLEIEGNENWSGPEIWRLSLHSVAAVVKLTLARGPAGWTAAGTVPPPNHGPPK